VCLLPVSEGELVLFLVIQNLVVVTAIAPHLPSLVPDIHHSKSLRLRLSFWESSKLCINDHELPAVLVRLIIGIVEKRGFGDCGLRRELGSPVTAVRVVRIHLVNGDEFC
jgi:hypothetical protein